MTPTGFEPVIFPVKGECPKPLDEGANKNCLEERTYGIQPSTATNGPAVPTLGTAYAFVRSSKEFGTSSWLVRATGLEPALHRQEDFKSPGSTIPPRPHIKLKNQQCQRTVNLSTMFLI